jgi:GDP-4-dehydro-6-deoxy-D-mannose reductase
VTTTPSPNTLDFPAENTQPAARRILITGATGFAGGYLVPQCHAAYPSADLIGLSHRAPAGVSRQGNTRIAHLHADMCDPQAVRQVIAEVRPDLIFHLAGQASVAASWRDPFGTLAANAGGAVHLFEALRAEGLAPRIVLIGSGEQYGRVRPEDNPIAETCPQQPANPYAVSKVAQDLYGFQYFVSYGLPILRVRAFNHFGPGQADAFVVASFARQIALIEAGMHPPVLLVGNLTAKRDFLPVEDVVRAYIAIAMRGQPGAAYNVGSGVARSIAEIVNTLLGLARTRIEVREDPTRLRPVDLPLLVAEVSHVQSDTGWSPIVPFEAALAGTLEYWRKRVRSE